MKLEMANCPKCNRQTIQGKATVPRWKKGNSTSCFGEKVAVCSVCGWYIHRQRVWQERCFDPNDYDLEVK